MPSASTPAPSAPSAPPGSDVPAMMHIAEPFTFSSVAEHPRLQLDNNDIAQYRQNPDPLVGEIFVFLDEGDIESAFMVTSVMLVVKGQSKEKFFYVQYADEGNASFAFKNDDFFHLLIKSVQVIL